MEITTTVHTEKEEQRQTNEGETWLFGRAPERLALQRLERERAEIKSLGNLTDIDRPPNSPGSEAAGHAGWIYVADRQTLNHGHLSGAWLPAHLSAVVAAEAISEICGQKRSRYQLVVLDQLGCGDQMVDEDHFTPDRYQELARQEAEL